MKQTLLLSAVFAWLAFLYCQLTKGRAFAWSQAFFQAATVISLVTLAILILS